MTSTEVERLVEDGEVAPDLPGEWGAYYWRSPDNATEITLPELGGLLRDITAGKQRREQELSTMNWWLGDIMNYGLDRYQEGFYQLVEAADYVEESLNNIARTARAFPPERRWPPEQISFWGHSEVSTLKPHIADDLLESYANGELPGRVALRKEVKAIREQHDGKLDADDALPILHDCPACHGIGRVGEEERDYILRRLEGV